MLKQEWSRENLECGPFTRMPLAGLGRTGLIRPISSVNLAGSSAVCLRLFVCVPTSRHWEVITGCEDQVAASLSRTEKRESKMATAVTTAAGTTAAVLLRGAGRRPLLRSVSTAAAVFTSFRLLPPPPPPLPPLQGTETASARGRFNPSAVARSGVTTGAAAVTLICRYPTTRRCLSSGASSEGGDGGEQAGRGAAAETGPAIPLGSKLAFKTIVDGKSMPPNDFEGKAVLVVNTASLCGLTPQLKELELVHKRFRGEGLVVLGVPSNDFGAQEPWDEEEIKDFYAKDFGVTFPLTSKTVVVGPEAHPLYSAVIAEFGQDVGPQWNFHKLLVGADGALAGVFGSNLSPLEPDMTEAIEDALPVKSKPVP